MFYCIDYYNLFEFQLYNETHQSELTHTSLEQCSNTCNITPECNGFNYNSKYSLCTILYTDAFSPQQLISRHSVGFYMKSLDACYTYDEFYAVSGIIFVVLLIAYCICCIKGRKTKQQYVVMADTETIPPAYGSINVI